MSRRERGGDSFFADCREIGSGAAGRIRASTRFNLCLFEAALGAWDLRPLFMSHLTRVLALRCALRRCRGHMRNLPILFRFRKTPLDTSFEETSPQA